MRWIGAKQVGIVSSLAFLTAAANVFSMQAETRNRTAPVAVLSATAGDAGQPYALDGTATRGPQSSPQAVAQGGTDAAAATVGTAAAPKVIATVAPPKLSSVEITRSIQRELNDRQYGAGRPDGVAGMMTRAAIMAYEQDFGLTITGEPSEELLSRIVLGASANSGGAARQSAQPQSKAATDVVRHVKKQLTALGYATGAGDGALTDEIAAAIRTFEGQNGLPVSGRISAPLVNALATRVAALQNSQQSRR